MIKEGAAGSRFKTHVHGKILNSQNPRAELPPSLLASRGKRLLQPLPLPHTQTPAKNGTLLP